MRLEHFAYLRSCKTEDFIGSGLEFVEFRPAWPIRGDELDHDPADAAGDDSLLAHRQPRRRLAERHRRHPLGLSLTLAEMIQSLR